MIAGIGSRKASELCLLAGNWCTVSCALPVVTCCQSTLGVDDFTGNVQSVGFNTMAPKGPLQDVSAPAVVVACILKVLPAYWVSLWLRSSAYNGSLKALNTSKFNVLMCRMWLRLH
jgi:hypothetical protein